MTLHVLVTGAGGFLGRQLVNHLVDKGYRVTALCRRPTDALPPGAVAWVLADLCTLSDAAVDRMRDVDCVIHCAGRAHMLVDTAENPLDEFRKANVNATLTLARLAAVARVPRFIFISSIGVNGVSSGPKAFGPDDTPNPTTPYTVSKWEAEQGLAKLSQETGLEVVIIRPPLIYGPGAPGNFAKLLRIVNWRLPLPFGCLQNLRSFVALENVVHLIVRCVDHPRAANQIFLVSDGEDLSTTDFIRRIAKAQGKSIMLVPVPQKWLEKLAGLIGKQQQLRKVTDALQIDIEKTVKMLSWKPVISIDEALIEATRYRDSNRQRGGV